MLSSADSDGVPRRARGALESAVMDVLWRSDRPLNPGEVRDLLTHAGNIGSGSSGDSGASDSGVTNGGTDSSGVPDAPDGRDLSYSTVVTILTRLHAKKMLVRTRVGRSFQYAPQADAAGLAARRLTALLDDSADREAVLSRFVADLPDRDEELLRRLLSRPDGE